MIRTCALALALLAPVQAAALSCIKPEVSRSFAQVASSDDSYVILKGALTFDAALLPKSDSDPLPESTTLPARLTGHILTQEGFVNPVDVLIDYNAICQAAWCGGGTSGEDVVAFVRETEKGLLLEVEPCGGRIFPVNEETLSQLATCMTEGTCTE